MDYDIALPDRDDADIISYAAGHKALGLYALWALRNEIVRVDLSRTPASDERLSSFGWRTSWGSARTPWA